MGQASLSISERSIDPQRSSALVNHSTHTISTSTSIPASSVQIRDPRHSRHSCTSCCYRLTQPSLIHPTASLGKHNQGIDVAKSLSHGTIRGNCSVAAQASGSPSPILDPTSLIDLLRRCTRADKPKPPSPEGGRATAKATCAQIMAMEFGTCESSSRTSEGSHKRSEEVGRRGLEGAFHQQFLPHRRRSSRLSCSFTPLARVHDEIHQQHVRLRLDERLTFAFMVMDRCKVMSSIAKCHCVDVYCTAIVGAGRRLCTFDQLAVYRYTCAYPRTILLRTLNNNLSPCYDLTLNDFMVDGVHELKSRRSSFLCVMSSRPRICTSPMKP
ncbi:hypothetical protein G7K_5239-t1 [Saitoella complicata NRRL Y-17804]|uniref:Uncharacterized protein n=1 Tax=Saitoella complicata (strain BCRC 22490 / CBS 7301 / JCM 7358 / NBRC 10748 / NRRL Y-17804) TaxID=698492 RepID=A0A0E9NMV0_SAICN|nr:hypothetical protein G7K_5239-t1 [Saitoella complicata NRRL Y-17804]